MKGYFLLVICVFLVCNVLQEGQTDGVDMFEFIELLRLNSDYLFVESDIKIDLAPPEFDGDLNIQIEQ